jgi:hypothetical protein
LFFAVEQINAYSLIYAFTSLGTLGASSPSIKKGIPQLNEECPQLSKVI